ncbi:hypothetical protein JCM8097_008889 [Rhodosporidiobolus ruineniae]
MPPRRKIPAKATPAAAPPPPPEGAPKPGENRYLPAADAELFRQALTLYESKTNKKGLEVTTDILSRHPDHGETLCMHGIFLHSLGKKDEGYAHLERGTQLDPGSHIVWHVYALMRRSDKEFEEALRCYKKACEIEKDSLNLLTDLSTLTVHLRRYSEYVDVRLQILKVQPRLRRNWLALAVAQFLDKQYAGACQTLTHYEAMLREVPDGDVEFGEVLLFHAQVLEEAGEKEKCLEFLSEWSAKITDKTAYAVQRARLLLALGRSESALWAWEALLGENPESREYIRAMVQAKGADCDDKSPTGREASVKVLDELAEKYPRSLGIKRLALDLASGDVFRTKLTAYLLSALSKGVPSLFADIKALYKLPDGEGAEKAKVVGEVVEKFRKELEEKGAVVTDDAGDDDIADAPSTYLWTLYFLASHHSHPLNPSSSQPLALQALDLASSHTPSLPELLTLRARILKRSGDAQGAAKAMEDARRLDGQDRFLNSKAAKYKIRAGDAEGAEKTAGLFTKKDAPSPLEDLVEMQCLWFLQEEGDTFVAKEDWGRALKRYHQIFDIFQEIEEDQYDFHAYCMRKSTLKAYIELLRFEDHLRDHPRFCAAAKGAIEIYLALHDKPSSFPAPAEEKKAEEEKPLSNGEAKPEEKKEEAAEGEKVEGGKKKKNKGKKPATDAKKDAAAPAAEEPEEPVTPNFYTDSDPSGSSLLSAGRTSPLPTAQKFLAHLERTAPSSVETWRLSAEVNLRAGKLVKVLKALRTAHALEPTSPKTLSLVVRFKTAVDTAASENAAVLAVLRSGVEELLGGSTEPAQWVDEQLQRHGAASAEWIVEAAKAKLAAGASEEEVAALVAQVGSRDDLKPTIGDFTAALSFLRSLPSAPSSALSSLTASAAQRFPLARAFKTAEEVEKLDAELRAEEEEERKEAEVSEEK